MTGPTQLELHLPTLFDLGLKSVLLMAFAALATALLRRASAANRHAIGVAAFVSLLVLPCTQFVRPRFSLTLERDVRPAPTVIELPPVAATSPARSATDAAVVVRDRVPEPATREGVNWSAFGVAVWLAGVATALVRRVGAELQLRRLVGKSRAVVDGRVLAIGRRLAAEYVVRAELRESSDCRVPLAFGVRRPRVLLPLQAARWSDERLTAALRHEFGHVARRDCLTRWIADLACALYWLNPLVWFGARSLRLLQEQACDDLVLKSGARPDAYAAQLVDAVRSLQGDPPASHRAPAMAQASALETRVIAILDASRDRGPCGAMSTFAACLSAAVALVVCFAAQVRGADQDGAAAALDRGLAFLASRQNQDGSVAAEEFRGRVGATSLAGLAWLGDARHRPRAERAAKFVLASQRDDGFFVDPRGGSMYDHGFATLFLAEYCQATASAEAKDGLVKAVALIVKSQGPQGGWRYTPAPADGDTSISACQLAALAAARNAGVDVPDSAFTAGVGFLKSCQNPDGGFGYQGPMSSAFPRSAAALYASRVSAQWADPTSLPDAAKGSDYVLGFLPKAGSDLRHSQFYIHGHYYAGQALQYDGAGEWSRWRDALRDYLLASQTPDGAWTDSTSAEVATSEACLILQARKAAPAKVGRRRSP